MRQKQTPRNIKMAEEKLLTVHDFIHEALYNNESGYYMKQEIFCSDYITAPEISQVFGEVVAVHLLNSLREKIGQPKWREFSPHISVHIIELGPGRGTLMFDVLRVFQKFKSLYTDLNVHMLEVSPRLKEIQRQKLSPFAENVQWIDSISDLNTNSTRPIKRGPNKFNVVFVLANEFFDALPIKQLIKRQGAWQERLVKIDRDGRAEFNDNGSFPIKQICPGYSFYMGEICQMIASVDFGKALIIDYGDDTKQEHAEEFGHGDTLQSICQSQKTGVFENIGAQDITHSVDFGDLKRIATENLAREKLAQNFSQHFQTQGNFLLQNGLRERVESLCKTLPTKEATDLSLAAARLISARGMGGLFKVLDISTTAIK